MYGTPSQILGIKKGTNTGLATGDYDQGTFSRFFKIFYEDLKIKLKLFQFKFKIFLYLFSSQSNTNL